MSEPFMNNYNINTAFVILPLILSLILYLINKFKYNLQHKTLQRYSNLLKGEYCFYGIMFAGYIIALQQANLRAIQLHIIDKRHRCIICIWIAFCKLFFHYLVFFIYINVFFQGFISSSFFDVSDVVIDIIGKREEKKA